MESAAYLEFYGLAERPFSLTSDPRFLYSSRGFSTAFDEVVRAIEDRGGVIVITGERGVGRSTFCRALLERRGSETVLSVISDPGIGADDFFRALLTDFAEGPVAGEHGVDAMAAFLRSRDSGYRHAIVLVDEAQQISIAVFEQIRALLDSAANAAMHVHVLLVGPPQLVARLQHPLLRWMDAHVICRAAIRPLDGDEIGSYLDRRLRVAQATAASEGSDSRQLPAFAPAAIATIAAASHGNPRKVNLIADRALELASARATRTIDRRIAESAVAAAGHGDALAVRSTPTLWLAILTAVLASAVVRMLVVQRPVDRTAPALSPPSRVQPQASTPPATADIQPRPQTPSQPEPPRSTPAAGPLEAADSIVLIIGSFERGPRADAVVKEIAAKGLPVFARPGASGTSIVVMVGPYLTREEALEAQRRLSLQQYPAMGVRVER